MYNNVTKNEYGFYTLKELPTDEERKNYYKEKYYQEGKGSYEVNYTEEELCFFEEKLEQRYIIIKENLHINYKDCSDISLLDVGCGEGFALVFFRKKGFAVLGLDYSDAGIKNHNIGVLDNVMIGDIYNSIISLIANGSRFDIVNMDNVLEHVVDPKYLLENVCTLLNDGGIVVIEVPNDFSYLQEYFWNHGIIKKDYWVVPLDHISYFNKVGLINLCKDVGLNCVDYLSDILIEFSALNPNTNYFENKSVGKSCHFARIAQEHIFHSISPKKTIELYRILGEMELGRSIIGIFQKER